MLCYTQPVAYYSTGQAHNQQYQQAYIVASMPNTWGMLNRRHMRQQPSDPLTVGTLVCSLLLGILFLSLRLTCAAAACANATASLMEPATGSELVLNLQSGLIMIMVLDTAKGPMIIIMMIEPKVKRNDPN